MPFPHTVAEPDDHTDHDCGANGVAVLGDADEKPTRKPMRYVSLHHHSTYSFLDGYQLPEAHVRRVSDLGMSALALTEHGNISSHVKLEIAASGSGVKPLYGCELYCGGVGDNKTQRKNHLTVIAQDQEGYRNLLRLVTRSWQEFHYEPTTSWANLKEHSRGLVVLSGCTGSLLSTSLVGGKNVRPEDSSLERGLKVASQFKRVFGERYFLEVQAFPELENVKKINSMLVEISKRLAIPLVATGDVHYTQPTENELQKVLHGIGRAKTVEQLEQGWGYDVPLCPPVTDKAMYNRLVATGLSRAQSQEAILSTELIANGCSVQLPRMPMLRYPCEDSLSLWQEWLKRGWRYRGCHNLPPAKRRLYRERLQREMKTIEDKDFLDYFLIVSDLVRYAKDSGIAVGPARGSAAASLVCYLLRITEVDPMLYPNLVFERFIDVSRADLPDIDLDFDSTRRGEIREYAERKYGRDHVGLIGTFTMFKAKNSLDDVARVFRIPTYALDPLKEVLIDRTMGDLRGDSTLEDTVEMYDQAKAVLLEYPDLRHSMELEGNAKGLGVHAAGLVISPEPLDDVTAVYRRVMKKAGSDPVTVDVVGMDKYDVERMGMLKIDVLGLNTMSMLADALREIGKTLEDMYELKFDDPKVIDAFRQADVVGIFQFDGRAMRNITQELKPDSFDEICDINALARPGPLHNGATAAYIDVKWGRRQVEEEHPLLDAITKPTQGEIVYQEQILRIVREIGNFDWTHAAYIRKIISKKLGEQEFNRQYADFEKGALTHEGMTKDLARDIWNRCITAGAYAFNAAHSVSYGIIAYWCMWFKVYHPAVFFAACLRNLGAGEKGEKHRELLKDADRHGIRILPPSCQRSDITWTVEKGNLRGGFSQVSGIGDKSAKWFMDYRAANPDVRRWSDFTAIKGVGPKTIEKIKAFVASDDPYKVHWLERRIENVRSQLVSELGLPRTTHSSAEIPYARGDKDVPITWLGTVLQRNPKDLYELHFSRTGTELDPTEVRDPHLRDWVVLWCSDDGEPVIVTIDRWQYHKYKNAIWNMKLGEDLILVQGVKKAIQSRRAIYVQKLWVIDPEED